MEYSEMTQGDYVKINSTNEMELKLKHLEARIREWDYQTALTIKLEPHRDPSSLSQDALFNIWCREIADAMKTKTPSADAEAWKLWLKQKFIGTYRVTVGRDVIGGQVYATPKGKGNMAKFMHKVLVFADTKLNVRLSVPRNSEYVRVRQNELEKESKQKAKEESHHTAGSGKGSSATPKARSSKGEQQFGLL
jgi:hypothetical protein